MSRVSDFRSQVKGDKNQMVTFCPSSSVFCLLFLIPILLPRMSLAQNTPRELPPSAGAATGFAESPGVPSLGIPREAGAVSPKLEAPEGWEQELLRDPFWPVGYFPPNWQRKSESSSGGDAGSSSWDAALLKVKSSGTSRLGGRTAAIINGELKTEGDKIEVLYEGKTYQWEITGIDAAGKVQLKKLGAR